MALHGRAIGALQAKIVVPGAYVRTVLHPSHAEVNLVRVRGA